jgi:hypothetical protein
VWFRGNIHCCWQAACETGAGGVPASAGGEPGRRPGTRKPWIRHGCGRMWHPPLPCGKRRLPSPPGGGGRGRGPRPLVYCVCSCSGCRGGRGGGEGGTPGLCCSRPGRRSSSRARRSSCGRRRSLAWSRCRPPNCRTRCSSRRCRSSSWRTCCSSDRCRSSSCRSASASRGCPAPGPDPSQRGKPSQPPRRRSPARLAVTTRAERRRRPGRVAVSRVIAPACPGRPAPARGYGRSGPFDGDAAAKMGPRPKGSPSRAGAPPGRRRTALGAGRSSGLPAAAPGEAAGAGDAR